MSLRVTKQKPANILGVAIVTRDPARREELTRIVAHAGHAIADVASADVVLLDGAATAQQIEAALHSVAGGSPVRGAPEPAIEQRPRGFEELAERAAGVLLTPRELDVLAAIGAGSSNKAIARDLGISLHTVKFHIESLFRKLGARTRAEAVAKGLERRQTVEL
ncbi:MAG TPA: LuxR C-terminal-related transcriptional regulator [Steroidobacteraceae bacterium]|nr:LuxR C-terminal-related transcriptional regulator [Steroidobacteraceae bacterium]